MCKNNQDRAEQSAFGGGWGWVTYALKQDTQQWAVFTEEKARGWGGGGCVRMRDSKAPYFPFARTVVSSSQYSSYRQAS